MAQSMSSVVWLRGSVVVLPASLGRHLTLESHSAGFRSANSMLLESRFSVGALDEQLLVQDPVGEGLCGFGSVSTGSLV